MNQPISNPNLYLNSAEYYDYDTRDLVTADIPFYLDYAAKFGGDILELACGTGRVSIALAQNGFRVHGVDLSGPIKFWMNHGSTRRWSSGKLWSPKPVKKL